MTALRPCGGVQHRETKSADQDAVSREVEAIFAEVEHNPERWRR